MDRSYLTFNASNIITINLMVVIGFFVIGAFASLYWMIGGQSNGATNIVAQAVQA